MTSGEARASREKGSEDIPHAWGSLIRVSPALLSRSGGYENEGWRKSRAHTQPA